MKKIYTLKNKGVASLFSCLIVIIAIVGLSSCGGKGNDPTPVKKTPPAPTSVTVTEGGYVIDNFSGSTGVESMNIIGTDTTYTPRNPTACETSYNFTLNLLDNNKCEIKDGCYDITGTYSINGNVLTVIDGSKNTTFVHGKITVSPTNPYIFTFVASEFNTRYTLVNSSK